MKQIFTILLSVLAFTFASAQTNTAEKNGNWDDSKIWSKKHVPANGEVVEIPNDITIEVNDVEQMTGSNLDIRVYGGLVLNKGKLRIGDNSKITLFSAGRLSSIKGNGADEISIGGVEKYNGFMGTLRGPLFANKATNGFVEIGYTVLPVKFVSFYVTAATNQALVQWSTAEETDASYFEVQRSLNGTDWSAIGQVKAAGNTNQITKYSFADKNKVTGKIYYRIKQADTNGKTMYTNVQAISHAAASPITIIASQNKVAVQFAQPVKGKTEVLIVNPAGQVVAKQIVENVAGQVVLNNTSSLKGAHFIAVSNGSGIRATQQVIL